MRESHVDRTNPERPKVTKMALRQEVISRRDRVDAGAFTPKH
jgi:hypothetical protein